MISIHITTVKKDELNVYQAARKGGFCRSALGDQACKKRNSKQVLTPPTPALP